ncbi:LysM peptidoglycan-binding domain-containing protein [Litorimonas sp. RW-G-Af-16]|uniref:LysM peptidoglycan-binding domain-containing protein n=1 Tax=Litorimonas sp. RW-G-Af-16 TaxID=3241168 RepID=UPI00390C5833
MSKTVLIATAALALTLSACATSQENPNYQYSSKYKGDSPSKSYASYSQPTATTTYASNQGAITSTTNHACLNKETNRELLGGAIGGAVGAVAGKKVIGGTKGTVVGAVLGGAAGYGIGDKSIDCDPIQTQNVAAPITYGSNAYSSEPVTYSGETTTIASAPVTAPTDSYYGETVGTPGYEAIQGGVPYEAPAPVASPNSAPVAIADAQGSRESDQVAVQTISGPIVMATAPAAQSVDYDYSQNIIDANSPVAIPQDVETRTYTPSGAQGLNVSQGYVVKQGDTVYSLARQLCVGVTEVQSANGLSSNFGIQIGQRLDLPTSRC